PSAFKDIQPSDIILGKVTYGEIMTRYFDSKEYKQQLQVESDKEAGVDYTQFKALQSKGELPKNMTWLEYQKLKATQFGTELDTGGLSTTQRTKLGEYVGSVQDYGNRKEALEELEIFKTKIITEIGQSGYDLIKAEIDRLYPSEEGDRQIVWWNPLTWF
ncbi:MAG: hypothetical protein AABY22_30400, partial [Nanoarchaeota archaeon]